MPLTMEQEARLAETIAKRDAEVDEGVRKAQKAPSSTPPLRNWPLTKRELAILKLVVEGLTNAEIGKQLLIGEQTVKSHVRHVLDKLEARNRTHAATLAFRCGLVD